MSKATILYCIEAMVHGGTEKQLAALIKGLDRRRFAPTLCLLKPSTMDLAQFDCPTIELGFRTFRSTASIRCIARLRKFIADHRVDVVQTFFQDPAILGLAASLRTRVKFRIATFRDMGFWRTPAKVAQLRLAYFSFHGFIANSDAVAMQVHKLDRIPLDKIEIIPNGVVLAERVEREEKRPFTVGIVANLDRPVKRVDLFLHAAGLVNRTRPDVKFVIVGDGHLRPALTALASQLGIADHVSFLGSVVDVTRQIQQIDVGVISSDSEGLSNSILEYMAAAVPTVARRVGGNAELVVDGETGVLVDGRSPEVIAAAILTLVEDPIVRRRMGLRARQVVEREFSMPVCVRRHEEYYERVLN